MEKNFIFNPYLCYVRNTRRIRFSKPISGEIERISENQGTNDCDKQPNAKIMG